LPNLHRCYCCCLSCVVCATTDALRAIVVLASDCSQKTALNQKYGRGCVFGVADACRPKARFLPFSSSFHLFSLPSHARQGNDVVFLSLHVHIIRQVVIRSAFSQKSTFFSLASRPHPLHPTWSAHETAAVRRIIIITQTLAFIASAALLLSSASTAAAVTHPLVAPQVCRCGGLG
jgi:hypothetical protein